MEKCEQSFTQRKIICRLSSHRDQVVGDESVCSCGKHLLRVVPHKVVGLNMQVSKHFVRSPSADESDDVGVNLCQEK